jgi:hypothetical protein
MQDVIQLFLCVFQVDSPADVASGAVPGAKRAAVRKLGHELGIPADQLPLSSFRYLTRLHYCAPDTDTYGARPPWGEHEVFLSLLLFLMFLVLFSIVIHVGYALAILFQHACHLDMLQEVTR